MSGIRGEVRAITASLMFVSPQVWKKVVCGLLFTMQMHQLMLLESRGCMIGAIVMAVALLWYMPQTKLNWLAVCTAVILGSILAGPSVVGEFSSSFRQKEDLDVSAVGRFDLWKAGWRITCEYPLLGVGPWAGQRLVPQYIGLAAERKGLHNLFFEISTGCGIPALILYLTYFAIAWVIAVRALWSRRQDPLPEWAEVSYLATASGLVGYFVSSMFSSGALLESSYMLAAFSLATNLVLQHERRFEQAA
jgi:O-antigen ligase